MSDHPAAQLGLGLIGYEEARRQAELLPSRAIRARALNRVDTLRDLLSERRYRQEYRLSGLTVVRHVSCPVCPLSVYLGIRTTVRPYIRLGVPPRVHSGASLRHGVTLPRRPGCRCAPTK